MDCTQARVPARALPLTCSLCSIWECLHDPITHEVQLVTIHIKILIQAFRYDELQEQM